MNAEVIARELAEIPDPLVRAWAYIDETGRGLSSFAELLRGEYRQALIDRIQGIRIWLTLFSNELYCSHGYNLFSKNFNRD